MSRQQPPKSNPAVSLDEKRRQHNARIQQGSKSEVTRLTELEANVSRLIDIIGELEQNLRAQDRYLHRLLELMRKDRIRFQ